VSFERPKARILKRVPKFDAPVQRISWTPLAEILTSENYVQCQKISCAGCPVLFVMILTQFAPEMCIAARNRQKKSVKLLFWRSRSSKVINFGGNRKLVYDFLLVINSNLGPVSHRFWETATYWTTIPNVFYPPLIYRFARGDPFRISGKALRILKLDSSWQPTMKIRWS